MIPIKSDIATNNIVFFLSKSMISFVLIIAVCLMIATVSAADDFPDPSDVSAMAFYNAFNYSYDISDDEVNYNVTDSTIIQNFFDGIEDKKRDCSTLEAMYSVYVYVKYTSGSYEVFAIMGFDHIAKFGSDACYWVNQNARDIYESYKQE